MFNQNLSLMSIINTFVNSMTKSLFLLYQYMLNHSVLVSKKTASSTVRIYGTWPIRVFADQ